eukprot:XP_001696516.1 predicted protein [Chlamydomonas reinhardtii]
MSWMLLGRRLPCAAPQLCRCSTPSAASRAVATTARTARAGVQPAMPPPAAAAPPAARRIAAALVGPGPPPLQLRESAAAATPGAELVSASVTRRAASAPCLEAEEEVRHGYGFGGDRIRGGARAAWVRARDCSKHGALAFIKDRLLELLDCSLEPQALASVHKSGLGSSCEWLHCLVSKHKDKARPDEPAGSALSPLKQALSASNAMGTAVVLNGASLEANPEELSLSMFGLRVGAQQPDQSAPPDFAQARPISLNNLNNSCRSRDAFLAAFNPEPPRMAPETDVEGINRMLEGLDDMLADAATLRLLEQQEDAAASGPPPQGLEQPLHQQQQQWDMKGCYTPGYPPAHLPSDRDRFSQGTNMNVSVDPAVSGGHSGSMSYHSMGRTAATTITNNTMNNNSNMSESQFQAVSTRALPSPGPRNSRGVSAAAAGSSARALQASLLVGNQDVVDVVVHADGRIDCQYGEFRSVSSLALKVLRQRNPNRMACDGWQEVKLNGVRLDEMRQEAGRLLAREAAASGKLDHEERESMNALVQGLDS